MPGSCISTLHILTSLILIIALKVSIIIPHFTDGETESLRVIQLVSPST